MVELIILEKSGTLFGPLNQKWSLAFGRLDRLKNIVFMKILEAVSTVGSNGAVQYARRIIPELVSRGHEVILAALPDSWIAGELRGQVEIVETRFARWPLRHVRDMANFCRERQVDVVHSHLSRANNFAAMMHVLHGVPNLCHSHENNINLHYFFHDMIVAVSEDTLNQHRRYGAGRGKRGVVLHNFVDTRVFKPKSDRASRDVLRELIGVGQDVPVIVQAGEVKKRKGQSITLEALPEIWKNHPTARMVFIGKGTPLPSTDSRIHWLGRRADLPDLLPWATVSILPSLDDPCPLAALESVACAVPLVAARTGGIPEILSDGAGVLFEPGFAPGLAQAVSGVLSSRSMQEELSRKGYSRAVKEFAFAPHLERLESLLYNVAVRNRTRCPRGFQHPSSIG